MSDRQLPTTESIIDQINALLTEAPVRIATVNQNSKVYHRWNSRHSVLGEIVTVAYSEHRSTIGQTVFDSMHAVMHDYTSSDGDHLTTEYDLTKGRVLYVRTHPGNEHLSVTHEGESRAVRELNPSFDLGRIALLLDVYTSDSSN